MSGSAKDILLRPVKRWEADQCIERWHYSGRTYSKSRLSFGVFLKDRLLGAIQCGPSIDTSHALAIVPGTPWDGYLEINRMAFSDELPRNSESRALGVLFRELRIHAPQIEWVISYSDATQCGDGAIYRAAGMLLTAVRRNSTLYRTPAGDVVSDVGLRTSARLRARLGVSGGERCGRAEFDAAGLALLDGWQVRYLKILHAPAMKRIACRVMSYSEIPEAARMARGVRACDPGEGPWRPAKAGVRLDPHAPYQRSLPGTAASISDEMRKLPPADGSRRCAA